MITVMHIYLLKEISVNNTAAAGADANNSNKKVMFKNCAPFTDCINKVNNTQVDNAKYINIQKHLEGYGNIVKIYLL